MFIGLYTVTYDKISQDHIKQLDGVSLTLSQLNSIAKIADATSWPIAIAQFKKSHSIKDGIWVESIKEQKDINDLYVEKESDGKWKITTVSTASVPDLTNETFTSQAIDYDAKMADLVGDYPEYRLFHKEALAIGKVTKMYRSGIFAIDSGYAYDDPFSQAVAANMLAKNDGKWRCSRGFYVLEAKGGCPKCGEQLILHKEHMLFGFKCPTCKSVQMKYKGTLNNLRFLKTRTFDITITDIPCNPWSGVGATKESTNLEVKEMNRDALKRKLLDAGLAEDVIDARLSTVTDAELKEYDDIPEAKLLKELTKDMPAEEPEDEPAQAPADDEQTFVLDPSVLKEFAAIVDDRLTERLDGMSFDIGDQEISMKEMPEFLQLQKDVVEIKELLKILTADDAQRLKELDEETPRNGKLRVMRFKSKKDKMPMADDEEDAMDDGDEDDVVKKDLDNIVIKGANGKLAKSMTEFVLGGVK